MTAKSKDHVAAEESKHVCVNYLLDIMDFDLWPCRTTCVTRQMSHLLNKSGIHTLDKMLIRAAAAGICVYKSISIFW